MKKIIIFFSFLFVLQFFIPNLAFADMGPKPTAEIYVTLNGGVLSEEIFGGQIYTCLETEKDINTRIYFDALKFVEYDSSRNCYWTPTISPGGVWCANGKCTFLYYQYPSDFKFGVYLPSQDKVYMSNVVSNSNFQSTYQANILSDGSIYIEETTSFFLTDPVKKIYPFLTALVLTIIFELLLALMYVRYTKKTKKILKSVLLVNLISLPIVWFVFPLFLPTLGDSFIITIVLAEIFVFLFEGILLHLLNKDDLSQKSAFILSLLINAVSIIVGYFPFALVMVLFGLR